jgi:hypothetical protein
VEAVGKIAECEGELLEFLAVEPSGRAYESLLTLECKPSALQAALLLLGCKPDGKTGTRLALEIAWDADGQESRVPAEELLLERRSLKSPASLRWVFTGSRFVKLPGATEETFLADAEEAILATRTAVRRRASVRTLLAFLRKERRFDWSSERCAEAPAPGAGDGSGILGGASRESLSAGVGIPDSV